MAEGIKISDMEQVTTLKDSCCFPIVSDGENKKITQKDLYSLMTTDLQNQINSEISNRESGDSNLQRQITNTADDLSEHISNYNNQIQMFTKEHSSLSSSINSVDDKLDSETSERKSADSELEELIETITLHRLIKRKSVQVATSIFDSNKQYKVFLDYGDGNKTGYAVNCCVSGCTLVSTGDNFATIQLDNNYTKTSCVGYIEYVYL